ncbi:MAG: cytochrome c3 family protein [Nitrosomonadales bacterium]|nr:cytochrome c3 family protein [Nitrosomonadales bacterium]
MLIATKHLTGKQLTGALAVSALALGLIAAVTQVNAATGIAGTRHNLGTSNRDANGLTTPNPAGQASVGNTYTSGTDEICVFCHTPHAANTAPNAPLWNKALPGSAYTVYSSGTMQGAASLANNNMSLVCLSCHDGTQAMDNMINQPTTAGGAGYNATGARLAGTWYEGTNPAEGTKTLSGALNAPAYMELGTDLSNDHPVGIPYCGGNQTGLGKANCLDQDFNPVVQGANLTSYAVGTSTVIKERMRLYSTNSTLTVECGSCHDPHNDTNKTFLRVNNLGSAVCLTCHAK